MTTQELQNKSAQATARATSIHARLSGQAESEGRALTAGERGQIDAAIQDAKNAKERVARAHGDQSFLNKANELLGGSVTGTGGARTSHASVGAQFISSDTYQWFKTHRGSLPTGSWTSPASELMAATLTEDAASGGDLVVADYQPGILALPLRPLVMADLIAPGTTESNVVTYMKETTYTNAAAPVAEGAAKPESTLVFDAVSDPVQKIAHWLPVTEEMLEDVPALRSYLDARLRMGVQLTEDDQLLNGSGTAPAIRGILNRSGLATSIARTTETNADVILAQIAAIQAATNLQPDGIVMNPANFKTIRLTKDTNGQYYGSGPFTAPQQPTLWGIKVVLTSAITANTALVGCFKTAAQIFRKGGLRVEASNSHASYFVENKIAIRAEERLALAVYRASAFGTVTNLT